ncbi:MAG: putative Ig domain-containing protein [Candidatus Doudnabacteria bacterium]
MKKISFFTALIGIFAGLVVFAGSAHAMTPTLSLTGTGDGDSVQINVTGDPSVNVLLFYTKTNVGSQIATLGMTNASGNFSNTISSSGYGIAAGTSVYVETTGLNGPQSAAVAWPIASTSGTFSLSPTGVVLSAGQNSTITASNNGGNTLYLSNNSNPPVANANISGNQINITALSNGSTVLTVCTSGNTSTCASAYVTVQNSGGQALTFSLSNVTVAPGQSVPITISGGNGSYSTLNNSNSAVIQTNISGSTVTLSTNGTSGSAAITICSSDMAACGIINATAGSASTTALSLSPYNPTLAPGQSLNVTISGGASSTYYVSSNSNQTSLSTSVNGSNLTLTGNSYGTANLVVCSSSGSCGNLTVTVSYVSYGGTITLSQSSIVLLVGQVLSVTVTGGTTPYSLSPAQSNLFQASLNGNVVTLSGIAAGSSTVYVCSAGSACATLSVTVNASGAGTPITFSQNNINLSMGGITALTITGSGGYYASTNSNPSVATVQISGSTALVTAGSAGSNNISICQSGGQCAILFVTVSSGTSTVSIPAFSNTNPVITAGQVLNETISGGASSNYYILANTNPAVVQLSLNGNQLALSGLTGGSSTVAICATSNSCAVLTVTVNGTAASNIYFATTSLPLGIVGQAYNNQIMAAGGNGSYTFTLTSGSLPSGLTLSATGLLSGTPIGTANNNISIMAADSTGNSATANFTLTVNNAAPVAPAPASTGPYQNGQLILENGTVYIVYQNTKVGFASADAFVGLGYQFSNVTPVTDSGLAVSSKVVVTADGGHPRGSWLLSGQAVFFLTPDGLIPVPDWNTFLSNGGQAIFIVSANSFDLARPRLANMSMNDSRLSP